MGKGRDKKKKNSRKLQQETGGTGKKQNALQDGAPRTKKSKMRADDSDDEDIDAIIASFRAKQADKVKVCQETSEGPSPRVNWSVQVNPLSSELILFGGEHFDGKLTRFFSDLYRIDLKKDQLAWKRVSSPNSPSPRSAHQTVITPSQQLFLFGGEFGTSKETKFFHYRDFWQLDLKTFAWEEMTTVKPLPSPRSGHRMALWKHVMVLFGGFYDSGADTKYLDDLWLFDTREYQWHRATWLNDPNCRPSPRSGFQFVSLETGVLLYGGYCQVKGKKGEGEGQVLADMWLLRIDPADLKKTRWEKRKMSNSMTTPSPRSGACSVAARHGKSFYLFGGVQDEHINEELLNGTCLNDLWEFSVEKGQWRQLTMAKRGEGHPEPVPRYNATMSIVGSTALIMGGIYEREDRQYVLDDCHAVNLDKLDKYTCIRKLSVDLEVWTGSSDDDTSDDTDEDMSDDMSEDMSDDSDENSESESDSGSESESESSEPEHNQSNALASSYPQPYDGQALKDYFADHQAFWMDQAHTKYNTLTNQKQLRGEAFQLAQQAFNEFTLHRMLLK